jgi:protein TonB
MSNLYEGEHLERELTGESFAAPATGSVLLHLGLAAVVVAVGLVRFHHATWGGPAAGGAIRAQITTTIPLPNDQPPNENVLATEHPSPAPAPPAPKAPTKEAVDEKAIPVLGKQKEAAPKATPKAPPVKQPVIPDAKPTPNKQPITKPTNKAEYGEQAANNIPRAVQGVTTPGPTSITEGDFGTRFGWYVNQINRKMGQTWNKFEVDPRTPKGARVFMTFVVSRDGTPSSVQLDKSSGSPTLDRSCLRAAQRVDTFGPLPPGYGQNTLNVSYYCEY